mmetsp:Transcript_10989/g.13898  ORF Transcript_10989/g.13898 Transcript_10989/m.13898 type:complete len:185 (-) Transcript_10989:1655-2209(-)
MHSTERCAADTWKSNEAGAKFGDKLSDRIPYLFNVGVGNRDSQQYKLVVSFKGKLIICDTDAAMNIPNSKSMSSTSKLISIESLKLILLLPMSMNDISIFVDPTTDEPEPIRKPLVNTVGDSGYNKRGEGPIESKFSIIVSYILTSIPPDVPLNPKFQCSSNKVPSKSNVPLVPDCIDVTCDTI